GATCGIFPVDAETLRYLRLSGRSEEQIALVDAYAREQGLFHGPDTKESEYSATLELDLGSVTPSVAGPKRPQDRVDLFATRASFEQALPSLVKPKKKPVAASPSAPASAADSGSFGSPSKSSEITSVGYAPALVEPDVNHGSVVIAAITSCTNTSNPSV